jgi:hypothetical protein
VAVAGGLVAALVASLAHADLNMMLAAGIGVCLLGIAGAGAVPFIAGIFVKPLKIKVATPGLVEPYPPGATAGPSGTARL